MTPSAHSTSVWNRLGVFAAILLVTVGLVVVGCDSGGSNGGGAGPAWAGKWKADNDNVDPDIDIALSLSREEIIEAEDIVCNPDTTEVLNVSGNVLTTVRQPLMDTVKTTLEVQANGDTLKATRKVGTTSTTITYESADDNKSLFELLPNCP
jgi:hypothetical protein